MENLFQDAPPLSSEDQRLVDAYTKTGRTLDDLPYTEDFDRLYDELKSQGETRSESELLHRLFNLRKAGRLPRMGRAMTPPTRLSTFDEERLADLIAHAAGTIGQRDRLPYTQEFNDLVEAFNRHTDRHLDKHGVWRLVARIAK